MSTHRFPKWFLAETFAIEHDAKLPGRFVVRLRGVTGYGNSIARAANHALRNPKSKIQNPNSAS